jgi:hypothetical protein
MAVSGTLINKIFLLPQFSLKEKELMGKWVSIGVLKCIYVKILYWHSGDMCGKCSLEGYIIEGHQ